MGNRWDEVYGNSEPYEQVDVDQEEKNTLH
jgi:hypothetical protein